MQSCERRLPFCVAWFVLHSNLPYLKRKQIQLPRIFHVNSRQGRVPAAVPGRRAVIPLPLQSVALPVTRRQIVVHQQSFSYVFDEVSSVFNKALLHQNSSAQNWNYYPRTTSMPRLWS